MIGIKSHTHEERTQIIRKLIPLLQKKFGDNFIALAADGSYARGEDTDYSDLEVIVFLKRISDGVQVEHTIVDGLLVVIVPETKESIITKYLDVTQYWYASGAGKLLPIINKAFVEEINAFVPQDIERKCLLQIQNRWYEYQEITAKVLNNLKEQDRNAFALAFPLMIKELLIILSYLNQAPYITLGKYIEQALDFTLLPEGFKQVIEIQVGGNYENLSTIESLTKEVFSSLENILLDKDVKLYSEDLG